MNKQNIRKHFLNILFFAPILLGTQACDPDPKETELRTKVDAFIQQKLEESGTKGLSLAIVQKNRIIHARGFGLADESTNKPVNTGTLFRVGSLSKLFTATALMQLQDSAGLHIDRPLVEYVPDFSIKTGPLGGDSTSDDITLRHMLTHRSGMPSDFWHLNYSQLPPSLAEYTAQFRSEYTSYAPGQVTSYSNSAMTVLGHVIERVAGVSFYEYMEKELLSPMGMELSSFRQRDNMQGHLSKAYKGGAETPYNSLAEVPAATLYSNAQEMSNFIRMLLNRGRVKGERILKTKTLKEMFKQQNGQDLVDQSTDKKFGLAWRIAENYAGKSLWHKGSTGNFHSYLLIIPGQNLGIFMSANTAESEATIEEISLFVQETSLELLRDLKKPADPIKTHVPVAWSAGNLEQYPGLYSLSRVGLIKVIREEQQLKLQAFGRDFDLVLMSDGEILLQIAGQTVPGLSLGFETIDGQEFAVLNQNGGGFAGNRLTNKPEIPEEWLVRQGVYVNDNPGGLAPSLAQVSVEDGLLILRVQSAAGLQQVALIPVDGNRAYIHGIGRNAGEMIRFEENQGESENLILIGNTMIQVPAAAQN